MNHRLKKLASLLTSSLLATAGLVGLSAAPAHAANPVTIWDYESSPLVANPWPNLYGYSADNNGWANIVAVGPSDMPYGSGGMRGIKAVEGSGSYSGTNLGSIAATDSLINSNAMMSIVEFYAPASGETVRMKLEDNGSTTSIFADATTSAVGWQSLVFNFAVPQSGTYNSSVNYNKASLNYKPASTANSAGDTYFIGEVLFNTLRTTFNYETTPLCSTDGYISRYAFSADNNGWASVCASSDSGAATFGLRSIKAVEGSGAYSGTNLGSIAATESLISATSKVAKVQFFAPATGQVVRMRLENDAAWPNTAAIAADATTSGTGWQTLTFDFSNPTDGTSFVAGTKYSKAAITYKASSTVAGADPADVYWVDQVSFYGSTIAPLPLQQVDVRLISTQKNTSTDTYQWTFCGGASWCVDNNYYMKMIAAGSTTTVTYVLTEHGTTTPIAGATVNLRMNTGYSGSNATWSSGGTAFAAVPSWNGTDAGIISGNTNSSGEVSFTFTNTNTNGEVARVLNNANPYPSGCFSPQGQTKAALQPNVVALPGKLPGAQFVDVLWPHISSSTINTAIANGSDGVDCSARVIVGNQNNKGEYPHLRLEPEFLDTKFDASWWDGVWQYRDADSSAFLKYIPVGSTFKLTYVVTGKDNLPLAGASVSLIVNANNSCSKTFFLYENMLIGPDDCAGGGQTELPAKKTDTDGRVSFVLTNTNTVGEAMPADLNGLPNGKEVGTNIKPHLVGATQEGIDMLFAHFVQPTEKATVTAPSAATVAAGKSQWSTFTFTDESGKPMANAEVEYMINGFDSKSGYASTDSTGKVVIRSSNSSSATGKQVVAVSLIRPGKLPLHASAVVNWVSPIASVTASGAKGAVLVDVSSASGKSVKISVSGKVYTRTATSDAASFRIPASAGVKRVVVTVGGKTVTKTVTVSK